jgi:hypothetical protein
MVVQVPENLVNDITNATPRADFLRNTSAPINYNLLRQKAEVRTIFKLRPRGAG